MFGDQIKALRQAAKLNQVQLAEKLNVSKQSVSNWENNNIMPSIDMLIRISKTFSVSADYLLGLDDQRTLNVTGLSAEQIFHLQAIVDDLKQR